MANLPLALAKLGPDYRVVAVGAGFERALGTRVVSIGNIPIAQVRQLEFSMTPAPETTAPGGCASGWLSDHGHHATRLGHHRLPECRAHHSSG
jgi:hypothetical protein